MFQTVINAFQSTPPRGGRPVPLGPVIAITDISIHAPARGATYAGGAGSQSVIHFNPRPREGGDYHAYYYHTFQSQISIHAPARGATRLVPDLGQVAVISIHAPARGATSGNKSFLWVYLYFNPRPREGGDPPRLHAQGSGQVFQSTPPRGGRLTGSATVTYGGLISIHAPARGATVETYVLISRKLLFQSTPPRGGRPLHGRLLHHSAVISIHAPARGATRLVPDLGQVAVISIHAPARGATSGNKSFLWVYLYFNPRPREGGDPPRLHAQGSGQVFQSTPPRGGRLTGSATVTYGGLISIHAPARGATVETYVLISRKLLFQSTPPRGGRPLHGRLLHHSAVISIHAPARGATSPHLG